MEGIPERQRIYVNLNNVMLTLVNRMVPEEVLMEMPGKNHSKHAVLRLV